MEKLFHIKEHPLPWMVEMLGGVEHTNFFEGRATEYSRASTKGWDETFEEFWRLKQYSNEIVCHQKHKRNIIVQFDQYFQLYDEHHLQ